MIDFKLEKLRKLRKELFELQNKYLDFLCPDDTGNQTKIEQAFGLLIWEVDEKTRSLMGDKK